MPKRIFICADHGLAIIYFLQSEIVATLLNAGVEVVLLTDEMLQDAILQRFGRPGLYVESLRLKQAEQYAQNYQPGLQWWLGFLLRTGTSNQINTQAMDSYISQVGYESSGFRRAIYPAARLGVSLMRRSKAARSLVRSLRQRYTPGLYTDLFEKYQPSLVIASTYGWRHDRYLLREAAARGIPTAAAIVGWDNPSSYGLPAAEMNWVTCWSEVQKQELVKGSDWKPEQVHVGGIPSYDGYIQKTWLMSREAYFKLHGLDPERKLLSYAASFVTFSPNYRNMETLARLVAEDALDYPAQLLIRLHPNHFMNVALFQEERDRIRRLAQTLPHVHIVEPVPLGGSLGYYSGEDMPEKTSMMAYSDVFLTVYSTMVVEAAIHGRPIISVCLDIPGGWNQPDKFSLALTEIGNWPTHSRFIQAGAGRLAENETQLKTALNAYLKNPLADEAQRKAFIRNECTYSDGSAGRHTGEFILSLVKGRS